MKHLKKDTAGGTVRKRLCGFHSMNSCLYKMHSHHNLAVQGWDLWIQFRYVCDLKRSRVFDGVVNFVCHCSCDFGFHFSCFTLVAEHFSVPWSPTPEDASGNYIFNKWWCPKWCFQHQRQFHTDLQWIAKWIQRMEKADFLVSLQDEIVETSWWVRAEHHREFDRPAVLGGFSRTLTSLMPRRRQPFRTSWRPWTSTSSTMIEFNCLRILMHTLALAGNKAKLFSTMWRTTTISWRSWNVMAFNYLLKSKDGIYFANAIWLRNNVRWLPWRLPLWRRMPSSRPSTWFLDKITRHLFSPIAISKGKEKAEDMQLLKMMMNRSTSRKSPTTTPMTGRGRMATTRLTRPMATPMVGTPMTLIRRLSTSRTMRTAPRLMVLKCLGLKSMTKYTPRTWMPGRGSQISSLQEASTPSWRLVMVPACPLAFPVLLLARAIREEKGKQRRVQKAKVVVRL